MRILGLIPARGGSKGIPRKNIKTLHGKALISYSIASALACPLIDQLVVSTEDEEIAAISKAAGAALPFLRPAELATDHSPSIDTVIHALTFFEKQGNSFDAVCLLQATVPFRNPMDLQQALEKFVSSKADSLISVREVPHVYNPHWVYEEETETGFLKMAMGDSSIITRRQDLPKAYHRDGSIYISRKETVLENKSLYGEKIIHHEMIHSPNINIDTPADWDAAVTYAKTNL